ncbi:MAG: acyl carrier protein [Magnetococcales bacterium]|nr:acyl carrier protein [Magnetococcales bacterium]
MEPTELEARLITLVEQACGVPFQDTGCGVESDLLKKGVLDSMALVTLLLQAGETFGVAFEDDDMMNPAITTIAGLASLIDARQGN